MQKLFIYTPRLIFLFACFLTGNLTICSCSFFHKNEDETAEPMVKKNWKQVEELKNVDREFAAYSRDSGVKKAFVEYLDDNGILIRPNHYPLEGADALDYLSQMDDSNTEITWTVKDGDVAAAGDMGYTYGTYIVINKIEKDTVQEGTYSMIWKKQKSGDWKIVMDGGSSGLGEKRDALKNEKDLEQ